MELRSCSSWHYIRSLKGGLVVKSLNVNRRRPSPKFKTLKDIYEAEDQNNRNPDGELKGFLSGGIGIKVERLTMSDSDISEFSCGVDDNGTNNGLDGGSNSYLDDIECDMITLKEFKEKCKEKKRKHSKLVDSNNLGPGIGPCKETDVDDCDLMEPLIAWKARISKKSRLKTGSLKNLVSTSPRGALSILKVEEIPTDQDFVVFTESLIAVAKVKVEAPEPDNTVGYPPLLCDDRVDSSRDREATKINTEGDLDAEESVSDKTELWVISDPPSICDNQADSYDEDSTEAALIASEWDQENCCGEMPTEEASIATECESPLIYNDQDDYCESVPSGGTTIAPESDLGAETSTALTNGPRRSVISESHCESNAISECAEVLPREVTEIATEYFRGTEKLTSGIEQLQSCVLNEVYYDCEENTYSEPDIAEVIDDGDSYFAVQESNLEGYAYQDPCADISQELMLPNSNCSAGVSDSFPITIGSDPEALSPDVSLHGSPKQIEAYTGSDSSDSSAIYRFDEECNLVATSFFVSSPEDLPNAEENQSQSSDHCKKISSSGGEDDHYSKPDHPKRLLSTRKDISPESQEKLCQAIESIEIQEEDHYRPHKKLRFNQSNGNEANDNKDESHGRINIRFSLKPKHEKKNAQTNATPNVPQPFRDAPRFTTGCNSVESCSQSAIAFSQRQMQDIESIALKLTNELKTMKEIAEDRLYSDASPSASVKYKPSEVRMAIKSATKVEQLANKWLSMMARDCNRFCKIMTLAEKDSDSSKAEIVGNKERKKISFADETGEELCQVKFFEKTKPLETQTENSQIIRF